MRAVSKRLWHAVRPCRAQPTDGVPTNKATHRRRYQRVQVFMKIASHRSPRRPRSVRQVFSDITRSPHLRRGVFIAAAGLLLAGCAGGSSGSGHATAQDLLAFNHMQDASGIHTRDLLPEEKQVISKAVSL